MTTTVFFNETTTNKLFHIMTELDLAKNKVYKKLTTKANGIHQHAGVIYKNLHTYAVTKEQLDAIKEEYSMQRTSFF